MAQILALDPALKTGWAHSNGESGVYVNEGVTYGDRLYRFAYWLHGLLMRCPTDRIVYEKAHHRGGPPTLLGVGWVAEINRLAWAEGIESVVGCHTRTLKKHATGKGNAKKFEMREAAEREHPKIKLIDDNHVDALWLLHWAESEVIG